MDKKYIILRNPIDDRYKLVDEGDDCYAPCICDGETIADVINGAWLWNIHPSQIDIP